MTQLHDDLRETLHRQAANVSDDAVHRVASRNYRPRTSWVPGVAAIRRALHAGTTIDSAREEGTARPSDAGRARHADDGVPSRVRRPRRRVLAGSTLGLVGVTSGLVFALSGTAATPPALAVTREADGSVLVSVNTDQTTQPWVAGADQKLASMGIHEAIQISTAPGPATVTGPVSCQPSNGPVTLSASSITSHNGTVTLGYLRRVAHQEVRGAPVGPPVKVLLGADGTDVIPSGTTGAGTVHLGSCSYYPEPVRTGNTGNTGNTG